MKISTNWLSHYIDIPVTTEELSEILTDIGLEVEKISDSASIEGALEGLVVGEVISCEQHPDADRLKCTTVNVGAEEYNIVCGAPNVAKGQKVVVALPGTTIYPLKGEPFKIKKAKIRGVESYGMICAEDEIGLGESHDGIIVLPEDVEAGLSAAEYYSVEKDTVIEIGLTPNRADAMSHYGVARDLMVAFKQRGIKTKDAKCCIPNVDSYQAGSHSFSIEIEDAERCPKYLGLLMENITVAESPNWLKNKLLSIGLTPKNNIVDITNYVLHEIGQPLHAFDAEVVKDKVIVRTAKENEKFKTLDGVERELDAEDLVIANENDVMCIAGVLGGEDSGVSEGTTSIFLESAYFNPVSVRKSAKRHGLNTDASFRFERGIDPSITLYALKRAAMLIEELAGGKASSKIEVIGSLTGNNPEFEVDLDKINKLNGTEMSHSEMLDILNWLEIDTEQVENSRYKLTVPAYRVDVTRPADIAEEILRIYGFNQVAIPSKLNSSITLSDANSDEKEFQLISNLLASNGFTEIMSNSLTKATYAENFGDRKINSDHSIEMLNPLSSDLSVLRQSLLFGALETVKRNVNFGNANQRLFEFGKTYHNFNGKLVENRQLLIALTGKRFEEHWAVADRASDFFQIKGTVEAILGKLGLLKNYQLKELSTDGLTEGISYSIAKKAVADIGKVEENVLAEFGIKQNVFVAVFDWDTIISLRNMNKVKFKPLDKFPAVTRDLSLLLNKEVSFSEIEKAAKSQEKKLLKEVTLFDVYQGKNLPEDKKSYAVRFVLQDADKTLVDNEIDAVMKRITDKILSDFNATLR